MDIVKTVKELRETRFSRDTIELCWGLVPTMGALHRGHLALIEQARHVGAQKIIVSIFVNPKQFGPGEDFDRYPRNFADDCSKLREAGCDLLFAPGVEDVYPPGFATRISVPSLAEHLCGACRPGHFEGVATVVAKLLLMALPDLAVFGEKDFQQLKVIERLALDLHLRTRIIPAAIVRERDGLAMSSRNAYLTDKQRQIASNLPRLLFQTRDLLRKGEDMQTALAWAQQELLEYRFDSVDYFCVCSGDDLAVAQTIDPAARLLVAARLGSVRLLDNCAV